MDRIVPCRRPVLLVLATLLCLGHWPTTMGLARRPDLSDMPAGDPGDGVLRPFESEQGASTPQAQSETATSASERTPPLQYLLVPMVAPAGQPWSLAFRLVRIEHPATAAPAWRPFPSGGRWHRAP
ncbi:MAG: hypothetical protein IPK64_04235 [bacterium]|nr:hypothetical protein [bacterium]